MVKTNGRWIESAFFQAVLLLVAVPAGAQPYPYRMTEIGALNANQSGAWAVNNSGHVVGYLSGGITGAQAYYYDGESTTAIGTAGSVNNHANDINDADIIVGAYGLVSRAFIYDTGIISYVGTLGGATSVAFGINEANHVVGSASTGSEDHAFLYDGETILDLGTLGGNESRALDINEADQIVGFARDTDGWRRAFLYEGGLMTDLGTLGGATSWAFAVNDHGHVVGQADLGPGAPVQRTQAFVYDGETMRGLGTFGGYSSGARDINNSGHIVGWASYDPGEHVDVPLAFFYDGTTMHELNSLIDPLDPLAGTVILDNANSISDTGFIVAEGRGPDNFKRAYLLTPRDVGPFTDVPSTHWAAAFIGALADSGVTAGCGGGRFCPDGLVDRAQMAVFLERGVHGAEFAPIPATGNFFLDVDAESFGAAFIEQLAREGITSGCGGNNYCPSSPVTRAAMAVFLLRAMRGAEYVPPAPSGQFGDVNVAYWAAAWIEQLAAEGITSGCGDGSFCPEEPVTRAQMAVFLVRAFEL